MMSTFNSASQIRVDEARLNIRGNGFEAEDRRPFLTLGFSINYPHLPQQRPGSPV